MSIQDDCQLVTLISQKWGKAGKPYEPYLFKKNDSRPNSIYEFYKKKLKKNLKILRVVLIKCFINKVLL